MYNAFVDENGNLVEYEVSDDWGDVSEYADMFTIESEDDPYEYDDSDGWDDGSDVSCGDCPVDECTGHCFSCSYRSF